MGDIYRALENFASTESLEERLRQLREEEYPYGEAQRQRTIEVYSRIIRERKGIKLVT